MTEIVCQFCNEYFHNSKSCTKYRTEESRKKRAYSKKFCYSCFSKLTHFPNVKKCESNKNCVGWFSIEHHKLFCAERIKAFKFFIPKIDQTLFKRFIDTFEIDEKYSFTLSSPENANLVSLENIKIIDSFASNEFKRFSTSHIYLVNNKMKIVGSDSVKDKMIFDLIMAKTLIPLPKSLHIDGSKLAGDKILQLLSHHTKDFCIYDSHSISKLSFLEIIKNAQNLEKLVVLWTTTFIFEFSWIQNLLKYKIGNNFKELRVILDVVELDVENLVEFVKTKCIETAKIEIRFNRSLQNNKENDKKFDEIIKNLEQYFDHWDEEVAGFRIGFDGSKNFQFFSLQLFEEKEDKEKVMPRRTATKRKYVY